VARVLRHCCRCVALFHPASFDFISCSAYFRKGCRASLCAPFLGRCGVSFGDGAFPAFRCSRACLALCRASERGTAGKLRPPLQNARIGYWPLGLWGGAGSPECAAKDRASLGFLSRKGEQALSVGQVEKPRAGPMGGDLDHFVGAVKAMRTQWRAEDVVAAGQPPSGQAAAKAVPYETGYVMEGRQARAFSRCHSPVAPLPSTASLR
jgi:hypothetical protein